MISLINHLTGTCSFPGTLIFTTTPNIIRTFAIPSTLWLITLRIWCKVRKSSKPILMLTLLLHIMIKKFQVCRKLKNYIFFLLPSTRPTWLIRHFDAKNLIRNLKWKVIELCHLLTVLLTHFRVTWTVPIWTYFFILFWYRKYIHIFHRYWLKIMSRRSSTFFGLSLVIFRKFNQLLEKIFNILFVIFEIL